MQFGTRLVTIPLLLAVANCAHLNDPVASAQSGVESGGQSESSKKGSDLVPYMWHDGEREHRVWMDPSLVAEVNPTASTRSTLGQATVRADIKTGGQTVRYWKLEKGTNAEGMLEKLAADHAPGSFSPVWHDSPSTEGPVRILPGNIVVILDPNWSQEAVSQWVERRQLRVLSRLPFGPNMLLIESDAGIPALELANSLHRSGEVKAAFPDWLAQKTLK
ncbi:hypothetical protein YTPLAS18_19880 [Nitrospira sp.]|nr:hypothetical protein YTPLAS18_19880 [Nitrospira sp.]